MNNNQQIWRWNVDDVWQTFSSMFQEAYFADNSTSNIQRYHHLSACLLFGACSVESFLNKQFRTKFQNDMDEDTIFKKLRYTSLKQKLEKWPIEICKKKIDERVQDIITNYLNLRHEVTHRKRQDHSLYKELDETDTNDIISSVQKAFLTIYEGNAKAFPYWLLGWNYVGMNFNETHPTLINNQQFKYSLNNMGYRVPCFLADEAEAWEKKYMVGQKMFNAFQEQIYKTAPEIEPKQPKFLTAPRLCKRWWDKDLIKE